MRSTDGAMVEKIVEIYEEFATKHIDTLRSGKFTYIL